MAHITTAEVFAKATAHLSALETIQAELEGILERACASPDVTKATRNRMGNVTSNLRYAIANLSHLTENGD